MVWSHQDKAWNKFVHIVYGVFHYQSNIFDKKVFLLYLVSTSACSENITLYKYVVHYSEVRRRAVSNHQIMGNSIVCILAYFPRYWPLVREIHWSFWILLTKGQYCGKRFRDIYAIIRYDIF